MEPERRPKAAGVQAWPRLAAAAVAVVGIALALAAGCAWGAADTTALLDRADAIKLRDRTQFNALMAQIGAQVPQLPEEQRQWFRFLQGWDSAYEGRNAAAIAQLSRLAASSTDAVIRFRAYSTVAALFTDERRYRDAFEDLSRAQSLLPHVGDGRARAEGLLDAAQLYSRVGQYDLALGAARAVIDENWAGEGKCTGGEEKLEA